MQYYLGRNGQQTGPFTEEEVRSKLDAGDLSATDLIWTNGMEKWKPVGEVLDNPYRAGAAAMQPADFIPGGLREDRLASRWLRLVAQVVDGLIGLIAVGPLIPGYFALMKAHEQGMEIQTGEDLLRYFQPPALVLSGVLLLALCVLQAVLLSTRGQTLGKMATKVRIVRFEDDGHAGFVKAVLLRLGVPWLIGFVPLAGPIFGMVDPLFIFRQDRRCIHDLMAGTRVIKTD